MHGAGRLTDEVVERAANGDQAAHESLLEILEPQIVLMAAARLSPRPGHFDAVDEIVQQAMIATAAAVPGMRNRTVGGLKSLVSVIVSRRVADFIRRRKRRQVGGRPVASLETTVANLSRVGPLWQFLSTGGPSPLSAIRDAEQVSLVLTELGQLREAHRNIITMAFFDQLATRQIAEQLGTSRRAASMMLLRAIDALRGRVHAIESRTD